MTLLIDGYNLLWIFPPLRKQMTARNSESARKGLIELLTKLARSGKIRDAITVVFDGRSAPGSRVLSVPGVLDVIFAPHPATADSVIVDMVAASVDPGQIVVVTSDREVQNNSRRRGAAVMGIKKFLERYVPERKAAKVLHSHRKSSEGADEERRSEKPSARLGEFEVDMWLKEFGFAPDEGGQSDE